MLCVRRLLLKLLNIFRSSTSTRCQWKRSLWKQRMLFLKYKLSTVLLSDIRRACYLACVNLCGASMYIYITITHVFVRIFNPHYIIRELEGHLCARSSTKKKRTIVSVIRDGLIPFKEGYSILILPYPARFLPSFSFSPIARTSDHGSSFLLFHFATRDFCH